MHHWTVLLFLIAGDFILYYWKLKSCYWNRISFDIQSVQLTNVDNMVHKDTVSVNDTVVHNIALHWSGEGQAVCSNEHMTTHDNIIAHVLNTANHCERQRILRVSAEDAVICCSIWHYYRIRRVASREHKHKLISQNDTRSPKGENWQT